MKAKGKLINVFLVDKENPNGIKTYEIPKSVMKAISIPRTDLNSAAAKELITDEATVYFLFGEEETSEKPIAYIGQSETPTKRMNLQLKDKEFFNTAIFFISTKKNMNRAHIKFIEETCIQQALVANTYDLKYNKNSSANSKLDPQQKSFALELYEEIILILGIIGHPIFKETKQDNQPILVIDYKDITAQAIYSNEGMTVLNGSQAYKEEKAYAKFACRKRAELIEEGVLEMENEHFVFTRDYTFRTPSGAGQVVYGRNCNGRTDWKTKDGKTWGDLYEGSK